LSTDHDHFQAQFANSSKKFLAEKQKAFSEASEKALSCKQSKAAEDAMARAKKANEKRKADLLKSEVELALEEHERVVKREKDAKEREALKAKNDEERRATAEKVVEGACMPSCNVEGNIHDFRCTKHPDYEKTKEQENKRKAKAEKALAAENKKNEERLATSMKKEKMKREASTMGSSTVAVESKTPGEDEKGTAAKLPEGEGGDAAKREAAPVECLGSCDGDSHDLMCPNRPKEAKVTRRGKDSKPHKKTKAIIAEAEAHAIITACHYHDSLPCLVHRS
jgi:hypothetical protein